MTLYVVAFRQGQQAFQSILGAIGGMYEDNLYMSNLFAYLDDPDEATAVELPPPAVVASPRRASASRTSASGTPARTSWALAGPEPLHPEGTEPRARRPERRRQDDAHQAAHAPLRADRGAHPARRARPARPGTPTRCARASASSSRTSTSTSSRCARTSASAASSTWRTSRASSAPSSAAAPSEVVAALTEGLDTPLGRWFQDGVELSGGQWQKVALARAFMREEADILVLDEPTAALDAEAEHAVFERFRDAGAGPHDDPHLAPLPDGAHGRPHPRPRGRPGRRGTAPTTSSSQQARATRSSSRCRRRGICSRQGPDTATATVTLARFVRRLTLSE